MNNSRIILFLIIWLLSVFWSREAVCSVPRRQNTADAIAISKRFKQLDAKLPDSCRIILAEIHPAKRYEKLVYLDFRRKSQNKRMLDEWEFPSKMAAKKLRESFRELKRQKNIGTSRIPAQLHGTWISLKKFEGQWVLFKDEHRCQVSDSSIICEKNEAIQGMLIQQHKGNRSTHHLTLILCQSGNCKRIENVNIQIRIIDPKTMITEWTCRFSDGRIMQQTMCPIRHTAEYPLMVLHSTALREQETPIFDK